MKTIQIKQVILRGQNFTTFNLLNDVIDGSGSGNISTTEQVKRIRLASEIEKQVPKELWKTVTPKQDIGGQPKAPELKLSVTEISLEDADYNHLKELVIGMQWGISSPDIREFCNQFIGQTEQLKQTL